MGMLTDSELDRLERLAEDAEQGESVDWPDDEPKTITGFVARGVETVTYTDKRDRKEVTKRVLTVKTADGLVSIWEGPKALTRQLFDGEQRDGKPDVGPPVKGQAVIVKYLGVYPSQDGSNPFKKFKVVRGDPPASEPEIDWGGFGEPAADEAEQEPADLHEAA